MPGLRSGPGSQYIYERDPEELVVEWYDHGESVPYESANRLLLGPTERAVLALSLGLPEGVSTHELAHALAWRFDSYFEVRSYLDEQHLAYRHEVDFQP